MHKDKALAMSSYLINPDEEFLYIWSHNGSNSVQLKRSKGFKAQWQNNPHVSQLTMFPGILNGGD